MFTENTEYYLDPPLRFRKVARDINPRAYLSSKTIKHQRKS